MNNIEVFKDIKESSKIALKKILKERQLSTKEILFNERDIVDKVYFLKSGKISIFKMNDNGERKIIFILRSGEIINEISQIINRIVWLIFIKNFTFSLKQKMYGRTNYILCK